MMVRNPAVLSVVGVQASCEAVMVRVLPSLKLASAVRPVLLSVSPRL